MPRSSKNNTNIPRNHRCAFSNCEAAFRSRSDLFRHSVVHLEDKTMFLKYCDVPGCKYATLQKSNLKTHKNVHAKEKNRTCPHTTVDQKTGETTPCPFRTTDPGSLTRHRKKRHGYVPAARFRRKGKSSEGNDMEVDETSRETSCNTTASSLSTKAYEKAGYHSWETLLSQASLASQAHGPMLHGRPFVPASEDAEIAAFFAEHDAMIDATLSQVEDFLRTSPHPIASFSSSSASVSLPLEEEDLARPEQLPMLLASSSSSVFSPAASLHPSIFDQLQFFESSADASSSSTSSHSVSDSGNISTPSLLPSWGSGSEADLLAIPDVPVRITGFSEEDLDIFGNGSPFSDLLAKYGLDMEDGL
ncbi:hypothetical protein BXZ70DRAFT_1011995 [Cristinia sonorae]|uniref:C2H2-type domain-containing protein n=1 Tax=Cristinia sonorae TaxID=1940300 RepID=A0A8K0XKP0_9AGAR|nr:hypothetical protein BXZ70DRAFT_1011995 [Cristinia sonorae]